MEDISSNTQLSYRIENLQPVLSVKDIPTSRAFYLDILGFEEAPWGDDEFTCIHRDAWSVYLCKGAQGKPGMWLWVGFDGDIYLLHDQLKAQGVFIRQAPTNYSWALEMLVEDPDGHVLRFGTTPNLNEPYADKVN